MTEQRLQALLWSKSPCLNDCVLRSHRRPIDRRTPRSIRIGRQFARARRSDLFLEIFVSEIQLFLNEFWR